MTDKKHSRRCIGCGKVDYYENDKGMFTCANCKQVNLQRKKQYGDCPECGCAGLVKEKRPNGYTVCKNGHKWKSGAGVPAPMPGFERRECKECRVLFDATLESIRTLCSDCCDDCECKIVKHCINFGRNRDAANPFTCGAFDGGPRKHNSFKVPDFCPDLEGPGQLPTRADNMTEKVYRRCKGCGAINIMYKKGMGFSCEKCMMVNHYEGDNMTEQKRMPEETFKGLVGITGQLPTKAELMAKMQAACEAISIFSGGTVDVVDCRGYLRIRFHGEGFGYMMSKVHYRPEVVAPPKGALILYKTSCGIKSGFSHGDLNGNSELIYTMVLGGEHTFFADMWFCQSTGQKSANWRDEWTPEEFRK